MKKEKEPTHLAAARRLVKEVRPKDTSYRHHDSVVTWKGHAGAKRSQSHTDCSGLFNALLGFSGYNERELAKWLGAKRPRAKDYHATVMKSRGFTRITKLNDARPGDFLVVKYPPGEENTGHTMLVAGTPRPRQASKPVVEGTAQWEVEVIDSSRSGHGVTDTRREKDGTFREGIGHGVLRVYTTKSGAVAGYSWSLAPGSKYYPVKERPIAIGRMKPGYKPTAAE